MIPTGITREHVLEAIAQIKSGGIPKKREATKYQLVHDDRLYPPKLVLSLAVKVAVGQELSPSEFSGGDEANSYLTQLGFEIRAKRDDWSWKECYFAVWAYDQLDLDGSQIKAAMYREVAALIGRSEKSVEYKLQNVSSFDPRPRAQKPVAEAGNAQALLGEVFCWYWKDRSAARNQYAEFRNEFLFNQVQTQSHDPPPAEPGKHIVIEEGAASASPSSRRKRSQKLLEEGRKYFRSLSADGRLRCAACDFATPHGLEAEIVQLHHTAPIYESGLEGRKLGLQEALELLVPLCPTCHALAHTSRPPLSTSAIKAARQ